MKKLIKMLPLLGLVLAAVFAFAFSEPDRMERYGIDDTQIHLGWVDVTGVPAGSETYECNLSVQAQCLFDAPNGNPIPNSVGKFTLNGTPPFDN
jgi:hypothetical protein